jgi:capsular polysaccharide biosynthesis protein
MRNFILGVIVGIVVSTIGFAGLAKWLDKGVKTVKEVSKEMSK